ncbi:MAG: hypothetical protein N3C12_02265 [Candidatus Binatia bacterium]|nr:hypothetical protein [Candidatus Binatia bacterium]
MTGDGVADLVLFRQTTGLAVMEGLGNAQFGYRTLYTLVDADADVICCSELLDLDSDGRPDALTSYDLEAFDTAAAIFDDKGNVVQGTATGGVVILYNQAEAPPLFTPTPTRTPGVTSTWTPYRIVAPTPRLIAAVTATVMAP